VEKLGEFFLAPGYPDEIIYAFQDLERLDMPPTQDADEDMETILLTAQELESLFGRRTSRCQIDF